MNKPRRIRTQAGLDRALKNGEPHDFAIQLAGGMVFSRKTIHKVRKVYCIYNHIDNSIQTLTFKEIMTEGITNIGLAMKRGAFWILP